MTNERIQVMPDDGGVQVEGLTLDELTALRVKFEGDISVLDAEKIDLAEKLDAVTNARAAASSSLQRIQDEITHINGSLN